MTLPRLFARCSCVHDASPSHPLSSMLACSHSRTASRSWSMLNCGYFCRSISATLCRLVSFLRIDVLEGRSTALSVGEGGGDGSDEPVLFFMDMADFIFLQ